MAFIKKEESHVKGEPGGKFDMSAIPMAPPKGKAKEETKLNLPAVPEYKPPAGRGRRHGRYRGGNHIPHSTGNFRIKTVYNRDRQQVKMSISTIKPTTHNHWKSEQRAVNWALVERTIFDKLHRALFDIEPVPGDSGKLEVAINNAIPQQRSMFVEPEMVETTVTFNVRQISSPFLSPMPTKSRANNCKPSPGPVIKTDPFSQEAELSLAPLNPFTVPSTPLAQGSVIFSSNSQSTGSGSEATAFGGCQPKPLNEPELKIGWASAAVPSSSVQNGPAAE